MLDRNQKTRIGFNEILAHPVFAFLDWNKVGNLEYTRELITLFFSIDDMILMPFLSATWNFPEVKPSARQKLVKDEVEFKSYYQSPDEICIGETDSMRTKAKKHGQREVQVLRNAMGAVRDWVIEQPSWIAGEALGEYDFDWTAPEVAAEEERWNQDDDD